MEALWRSGMQSQVSRDDQMRSRVAVSTISAQKVVDKYNEPEKNVLPTSFQEKRIVSHPMHGYCLAELKLTTAGTPSTMAAANYYSLKSKQRRDELLAKYSNTEAAEQQ